MRGPEVHGTRKGNQWFFAMKAHIGVDADSGLVHKVVAMQANVRDLVVAGSLLHADEVVVHGDTGCWGTARWCEMTGVVWMLGMQPGMRCLPAPGSAEAVAERAKASVRANVEHPFRVIKRQVGHVKVRYREGLEKNWSRLVTLFALSNIWMARCTLRAG